MPNIFNRVEHKKKDKDVPVAPVVNEPPTQVEARSDNTDTGVIWQLYDQRGTLLGTETFASVPEAKIFASENFPDVPFNFHPRGIL